MYKSVHCGYGNCGLLRSSIKILRTSTDTVLIVGELYYRYGSSSLVSSGDRSSPHGGTVHLSHVHGLLGDIAASIRSHPEPKGSIVSENRRTLYKEQQSNFNNTTISNLCSSWCCGGCDYSLDWSTGLEYWTGLLDCVVRLY